MEARMPGVGGFPFGAFGGQPAEEATHEASAVPAGPSMRFNTLAGSLGGIFNPLGVGGVAGGGAPPPPPPGAPAPSLPGGFGFPGSPFGGFGGIGGIGGIPGLGGFPPPPPPPPPPPGTQPPPPPPGVAFTPPQIFTLDPSVFLPPFRLPPVTKTATQLAESAIVTLNNASAEVVEEALNTLRGRNVTADHLIDYLERRVRVGEVLNQLASTWSDTTVGDFADAFQMDRGKREVMDAIVAIGILNEPELDEEILVENTPQTTDQELLDNRVIAQQFPAGGTVMQPPYLILVAVEYRAVADAQERVDAIMGQLAEHTGIKLPRPTVERLRARG
jgi:hypothetical protein